MGKLFGTDGIRGKADTYPMTEEVAAKVGFAVASLFGSKTEPAKILIGRDTRESGVRFVKSLISGIYNYKGKAILSGVLPTPGVSYLVSSNDFDAGIVVSASHNPVEDNGIKIFDGNGYKLTDEREADIETVVLNSRMPEIPILHEVESSVPVYPQPAHTYTEFLKTCFKQNVSLKNLKLVVDCANGSTSAIAPNLFNDMGADVHSLSCKPNGRNINDHCGSEYPETMMQAVLETSADMGIAFDGDGDRLIVADETGSLVTGDQMIAIFACFFKNQGKLINNTVVSTIMSNMGLGAALRCMDIQHIITAVGDRYVAKKMIETGAVIGGEDSGHIILMENQKTGDGIVAALKLLEVIRCENKPLSELKKVMTVYPQELVNVPAPNKPDLDSFPEISDIINTVKKKLGQEGRVLVRYSGTQPLCRILVEGPDPETIKSYCKEISDSITKNIN